MFGLDPLVNRFWKSFSLTPKDSRIGNDEQDQLSRIKNLESDKSRYRSERNDAQDEATGYRNEKNNAQDEATKYRDQRNEQYDACAKYQDEITSLKLALQQQAPGKIPVISSALNAGQTLPEGSLNSSR